MYRCIYQSDVNVVTNNAHLQPICYKSVAVCVRCTGGVARNGLPSWSASVLSVWNLGAGQLK